MAVTLTVGSNSWVTLAEANTFLESIFDTNWSGISTDDDKKKCLITAFWLIYTWPEVSIPKNSTDENVKIAQMRLADWVYSNYSEWKDRASLIAGGVKNFALSKWRESLDKSSLPIEVQNLLDDSMLNAGGYFPTFSRELEN